MENTNEEVGITVLDEGVLETQYIPGNDIDFTIFVQSLKDKAELCAVGGKFRWVVTHSDGTRVIIRPASTNVEGECTSN